MLLESDRPLRRIGEVAEILKMATPEDLAPPEPEWRPEPPEAAESGTESTTGQDMPQEPSMALVPIMANMQAAIENILEAHNLLADYQASPEFYVKFTQPSFDPLVIERHGEQVVVGHYFIQNGDVMADPEILASRIAGRARESAGDVASRLARQARIGKMIAAYRSTEFPAGPACRPDR